MELDQRRLRHVGSCLHGLYNFLPHNFLEPSVLSTDTQMVISDSHRNSGASKMDEPRAPYYILDGLAGLSVAGADVVEIVPIYDSPGKATVPTVAQISLSLPTLVVDTPVTSKADLGKQALSCQSVVRLVEFSMAGTRNRSRPPRHCRRH